ncbi:DUF2238 domain-containing protein [Luedemannella flava]|uniref:DUF2238 domain-containing protein n=1 Tax=Luedemannella flava TaxID=349316 RepID=A0ABP4XNZ8_9ACTN
MVTGERAALAIFAALVAATWWRPPHPAEQALHHGLTLIALVALWWVHRRRRLPLGSLVLILVFLALHSVAARWLYSEVPYDEWSRALLGWSVNERLGWTRNNFDRLVHVSYGACLAPVLIRYLVDARGWAPRRAALAAIEVTLSTSALYELLEWGVAMALSPATAEAYNGQQGDLWDPHKDMACALAGALLAAAVTLAARPRPPADAPGDQPAGSRRIRIHR